MSDPGDLRPQSGCTSGESGAFYGPDGIMDTNTASRNAGRGCSGSGFELGNGFGEACTNSKGLEMVVEDDSGETSAASGQGPGSNINAKLPTVRLEGLSLGLNSELSVEKRQCGEGDDEDEDLPPALRFVAPGDVVDISEGSAMRSFEWFGTQGQKVTVIQGLDELVNLEYFCLRSNFVREVSGLAPLTNLVYLELYENRINSINGLEKLVKLEVLDLSYNRLRELDGQVLAPLVNLKRLYLTQNRISKIQGLETLTNLNVLELGMNRIRKLEGLDTLTNLRELWLGRNKIEKIENIGSLRNLVRLSLQSNRLRQVGNGLENLVLLEELYLSFQGIQNIDGLDNLTNLNTIDLSNNEISSFDGLPAEKLHKLEELWMSCNKFSTFKEIEKLSPLGGTLKTIYLDQNPVAKEFQYRIYLAKVVPSLVQIDATPRR